MLSTQLLHYYRQLDQQLFTVVDVETTGSLAKNCRVTEISVLQATLAHGIQHQQTHLVNPQATIPPRIVEVTGITQDMVSQAPPAADIFPQYLALLQTGILTAHNLDFDYAFLKAEYARLATPFSRPASEQLCTVQLARLMLPHLPSRSLPNLVKRFKFKVKTSHRAEADTQACWLLAHRLLTQLQTETDEVLLSKFAQQWLPLQEAAKLLGCSQTVGRSQLEAAAIPSRIIHRGSYSTVMYQRGDVERILAQQQPQTQLSWF